jgi:hypothetical protein
LKIFLAIGVKEMVMNGILDDNGSPAPCSSDWVVCVIGGIMRDVEKAFESEVSFRKEKDVNVMD